MGIQKKDAWRVVAICSITFLLSVVVRLTEYPGWDHPTFRVDGERLLATNDAYFWVAGAEGANPVAESHPMSVLLGVLARIFGGPVANLAFWLSIALAALVAIPTALWCYSFGAPRAALLAAGVVTLAPAYYQRTRLGYYDTDWATLFFPLLFGWLLSVWLEPRLQGRGESAPRPAGDDRDRLVPFLLILAAWVAVPFHSAVGLLLVAELGLAALLVVLQGLPGTRSPSLSVLVASALPIVAGALGAGIGLLIVGSQATFSRIRSHPLLVPASAAILITLLIASTGGPFREYLVQALPAYTAGLVGGQPPAAPDWILVFPEVAASVRETQTVNLISTLEGSSFHPLLGALGVIGILYLSWKRPVTIFLVPMLLLGLASARIGIRFAMFAAPVLLIGSLVPPERLLLQSRWNPSWGRAALIGAAVVAVAILLPRMGPFTVRGEIETVVGRRHAEALMDLGRTADPGGTIWTWWDYGYAAQHFSGLETFADGRRNTGEYLVTLGAVLGSDSLDRSSRWMDFAARHRLKPWEEWRTWSEGEWNSWLAGNGTSGSLAGPRPGRQYLVVAWEAVRALPWIQYFGSWDFAADEGQRSATSKIARPLQLDLQDGVFRFDDNQVLPVVSVDLLGDPGGEHLEYPDRAGAPHLLLNRLTGEVYLLDETAYRSTLTQLLILPADELGEQAAFRLLIDDQPFVRVFELGGSP